MNSRKDMLRKLNLRKVMLPGDRDGGNPTANVRRKRPHHRARLCFQKRKVMLQVTAAPRQIVRARRDKPWCVATPHLAAPLELDPLLGASRRSTRLRSPMTKR